MPENPTTPLPAEQPLDVEEKARLAMLQEGGKQLAITLFVLTQMARIHDTANEAFRRPLETFRSTVQKLLGHGIEISVQFIEQQVYMNEIRLKLETSNFEYMEGLFTEFEKRQVGGLRITAVPTDEALCCFVKTFNKTVDPQDEDGRRLTPRELITRSLGEAGAQGIVLLKPVKITEEEQETDRGGLMNHAVNTYGGGIVALKDLMTGKSIAANLTKLSRVVQNFIDLEEKLGGDLLALLSIRGCGNYLLSHSMNTCLLCISLGRRLRLDKEHRHDLGVGALLHDVGKGPGFRPGASGEKSPEYEAHPVISFRFFVKQGVCNESVVRKACIALDHHLDFNGEGGFPQIRLRRKQTILTRIVAVANFYDSATTTIENVREGLFCDVALRRLLKEAGKTFDSVAAKMLVEMLGKYPIGSLVELDTGDIGIVLKSGKSENRMLRPLVMLVRDRYGEKITDGSKVDLTERHEKRKAYKYSIVRTHSPSRLKINVSALLLGTYRQS